MKTLETNIGRWVEVLHDGQLFIGTVIDEVPGTHRPKRIRVQRGYLQGEVLMPAQYVFRGWAEDNEIDP